MQSSLRFDSTGVQLWRRNYAPVVGGDMGELSYTPQGRLVLAGTAPDSPALDYRPKLLVAEPVQGDSVAGTFLPPPTGPVTETMRANNNTPANVLPLTRRRGYALATTIEPNNGSSPPHTSALVCLDSARQVRWRYAYPNPNPNVAPVVFSQVRELADGTLLALARSTRHSVRTAWLCRFDWQTGVLLNTYTVQPQLPAQVQLNYLLPVAADSTLLLAGPALTAAGPGGGQAVGFYVTRVRVAGLPRVVRVPFVPAGTLVTQARQAATAAGLLGLPYPNPATESVQLPYELARAQPACLELRDALGRVVWQQSLPVAASGSVQVPVRGLAAGLYVAALVIDAHTVVARRVAVQY